MSRHRNVRSVDADEEYEGYYSCYGHSVEDDFCISPQTEAQFLYDRNAKKQNMSVFFSTPELPEDETSEDENIDSMNGSFTKLNSVDSAKLQSCIEALQNVVGETISESVLKNAAIAFSFDVERALNAVLSDSVPKAPRKVKEKTTNVASPKVPEKTSNTIEPSKTICETEAKSKKADTATVISEKISSDKVTKSDNAKENNPIAKSKVVESSEQKSILQQPSDCEPSNNSERDKVPSVEATTPIKPLKDSTKVYEKERGQTKPLINLVVVGHVDAGKSTLMGHLLYSLGEVSKKAMHKFEQDSKKLGKSSFMYAWVLDETLEERNRGITMDIAQSKFETKHRIITLLDAPGHKDFIPNMISGAAEADVAILVVDSTKGEFETGFEAGGQTREHTMLIRSLGVTQVSVAINKMDNVQWSQDRYDEIVSKLSAFMKQTGFKDCDVCYVPCSGLTGENLIDPSQATELKKWYTGPTLLQVIDKFQPPERLINKPLRMSISDVFKGQTGGFCLSGKIEAGSVKLGEKVLVMPSAVQGTIKALTLNDVSEQNVFAGDHVIMQLTGIDAINVPNGSSVCEISNPIPVTSRLQAKLVIFTIAIPITKGFPVIIYYQSVSQQATIKKLISQLHRSSGEVIKKHPRCLVKNSSAVVEIETALPICIELYKDFKELGRFMLRSAGSTIAAGVVTEIL